MLKFNNNRILTVSVVAIVITILGISVFTLFNIRLAGRNMTSIYNDRVLPLQQIKKVSDAYRMDLECVQKTIFGIITADSALTVLSFASKQIELNWNNYLNTYLTPDEKEIIQRTLVLKSEADVLFSGVTNIFKKGVVSFKDSLLQQIDLNGLYLKTEALESCLNELINLQTEESGNLKSLTEDIFKRTIYLILLVVGLCILIFWLIAYKHRLEQTVSSQAHLLLEQNDKLKTAYEELQAANEELDVTNEELHAANEEFASVNEQLQDSNIRLEQMVLERTHTLAENEKKYRYIIDHAPLGIFQRTLEGKYIYSNPTLYHAFECETQDEFLSQYGEMSKRWYEPDKMNEFQKRLIENKEVMGFEGKTQLVDGSFKWFLLSARYEPETSLVNGFILDITREKLKEIAIRETESKIRAVFDLSYGFIGLLTPDGKVVEANRSSLEFVGADFNNVIGKFFWETPWWSHSLEFQEQIRSAVKQAANGEMLRFETIHPDKDGKNAIVDFSIKPVMDQHGNVIWLIPEGRDITERKEAETAITREKDRSAQYLNVAGVILVACDEKGCITLLNRKGYNLLGYEEGELLGQNWYKVCLPPEEYDQVYNAFLGIMSGKIELFEYYENHILNRDGEKRYIAWYNTVLRNEKGEITGTLSSGEDITERKLTEIALRENEERYRHITTLSGHIIYEYSANDASIKWAGAINLVTGYTWEEFVDINFERYLKMIHPEDLEESVKQFRNTIEKNSSVRTEYRFLTKDKGYIWIENESFAFFSEDGKVQKALGVMKDITSKKNMERQILNSVIETEERERMNFSQELHDGLGPLLSAAKMYVQLLGKQIEEEVRNEIMNDVEKLLEESSKTVREISFKLSPHILQNYGLLEALKAYAEKINETSDIEIKIESLGLIRFNEKIEIIIYRVISECISNTIKHAGADRISIKLNHSDDILMVEYKDNGKGFDVDKAQSSLSGIGLLNMKSRIRSINGSMTIESIPEEGTAIIFKIVISAIENFSKLELNSSND